MERHTRKQITPAEIGDIVRTARKHAGLRQYELAGVAGVGLRFMVELEAGKPTAQIGKVFDVLAALGCAVDIVPPPETAAPEQTAAPAQTTAPGSASDT